MSESQPDDYVVAHVRQALAEDPHLHDLTLDVAIRAGVVHVSGDVATEERRRAVSDVLARAAAGRDVRNDTTVVDFGEPEAEETLA